MNAKEKREWKKLRERIWEERVHISEVSGKPLLHKTHPQWAWQFAHVLAKGTYPAFALNPENIMLMLPEEHEKQEQFEIFNIRKEQLKAKYYDQSEYSYKNTVFKD